ncbi:MAG TPA: GNAT family N-acetyltransferase [Thermoguttaceae bacterium]|nr:GNAT family N-acetyltransferase [Thermoguttaceae bacterium]
MGEYAHAFVDHKGESILIETLGERTCQGLIDMYRAYEPKDSFDGLPPIKDAACVEWVQRMFQTGINLVALSSDGSVAGHAAIFPMNRRKCEMLMAVAPRFQNMGIGTELSRRSIELARELGFERMWLSVESRNARAKHVFKKCGFQSSGDEDPRDAEMVLELT